VGLLDAGRDELGDDGGGAVAVGSEGAGLGAGAGPAQSAPPESQAALLALPATARAIHAMVQPHDPLLAQLFHDYASIVGLVGADIQIARHPRLGPDFPVRLGGLLKRLTGRGWTIGFSDAVGEPSLLMCVQAEEDAARTAILESGLVKAAMRAFPDAELIDYSGPEPRSLAS